ncbi:glycosyl transferase [Acetobacter senegalensis]|uniref:glycosyl transferase n=1 Tax=Acetobacter senegalensis TaxID=446692 RepID=UPI00128D6F02|nr:glycosyl transferase [Acetobacter senegalensis]MCG4256522.1 glycosyl transferase [Acetobacter senegalensis]MCG4266428.1 glycosyl transferase [Acetobacter senegalensis]MPQ75065.1 glycosyl transferase [Acetobacter senegalensis]
MTVAQFPPLWQAFDPVWYRQEYKDVLGDAATLSDEDLAIWYQSQGAFSGHSPNRYFDEEWYRRNCREAQEALASGQYRSGFEHYCQIGFKTQSPHYLFSERYYTTRFPDANAQALASQGFANGYDHYLRVGDQEKRSGHLFFNPDVYLQNCPAEASDEPLPPFRQFLHTDRTLPNHVVLSEHFNPEWYARMNPNAVMMVEYGYMPNVLYQFLADFTPNGF